ncbi:Heterokaryon incompatibility protein [Paramyrothecium foliicola]|nr:Heterokaryon incompatibility protein [Paramyrothecium foliicola]
MRTLTHCRHLSKQQPYCYTSINHSSRALRLIRILPPVASLFQQTIHIEIETTTVESAGVYDALSYVWGVPADRAPDRRLIVDTPDGARELPVHRPLELALRSLPRNRLLFVDQICIDQSNEGEKVSQVLLMRDIYSNCASVLVWLGPETRQSNRYFDYTHQICGEGNGVMGRVMNFTSDQMLPVTEAIRNQSLEVDENVRGHRDDILTLLGQFGAQYPIDGLLDVLRRSWFNRLWTIQELCLAPQVTMLCGSRSLCLTCFRAGVMFYHFTVLRLPDVFMSRQEARKRREIIVRNKNLSALHQDRQFVHASTSRQHIYDIVIKYAVNDDMPKIGATVAVDRLFGLMGLADPQSLQGIQVSYKDAGHTLTATAALFLKQNVDVLLFSQFPKIIRDLPSWVPDWSMPLKNPFACEGLALRIFNAGGPRRHGIDFDVATRQISLPGVTVDEITRVGHESTQLDTEVYYVRSLDWTSVKAFFDEVTDFVRSSRSGDDLAAIRLSDASFSVRKLLIKAVDTQASKTLIAVHRDVYKFGQLHIGARPASIATRSPFDLIRYFFKVFALIVHMYRRLHYLVFGLNLQRQISRETLKSLAIDPDLFNSREWRIYTDGLWQNTGRKLYLTRNGYGCTVDDAAGVAKNNVLAFWEQTWWRILFAASQDTVLEKVVERAPHNLVAQREVRRHQVVVDTSTGDIVGYARWIMPSSRATEWTEAQTPAVSDADKKRLKDKFDAAELPFGEHQDEMDALDDPVNEKQDDLTPEGPYLKLDYLATRPDHQKRGISSMLVKSGLEQADRLGIDVMVTAMGYAATNLYKKHGFQLHWDLEQSLKPWGHDDVYYTAILTRHPSN